MNFLQRVGTRLTSLVLTVTLLLSGSLATAQTGFSFYSATGVSTLVWGLSSPTVPFASGCSFVVLSPATMGMDSYKIAVSTLLLARMTGRPIRFYSHAPRDGGCGADMIQLNEP
jgi:hypothetical protein